MKYHTSSEYDDVMAIRLNKETRWRDLIKKAELGQQFTEEEIRKTLEDIQEYVNCDFPTDKRNCDREILDSFELVCRVAKALAEANMLNKPMDRRYITNKLYVSLKFLALDKSDFKY